MRYILYPIFLPLSLIWSWLYSLRRYLYQTAILKSNYFLLPVISVGNVLMGGAGKTPFVSWLTELLQDNDLSVCILSRGYRSQLEKSFGILQKDSKVIDPELYGDEPVLLSSRLKDRSLVVVGKNRSTNLKKIFKKFLPDIVILDDGFQHLKMRRDINIVLFDVTVPLSKLHTPPLGYLREPLSSLNEADIIILNKVNNITSEQLAAYEDKIKEYVRDEIDILKTFYAASGVVSLGGEKELDISEIRGKDVLTFSGIANPDNFNQSILLNQANIAHTFNFSDHYQYKQEDIDKIVEISNEKGLMILTTEKDAVKLKQFKNIDNIYYLKINLEFVEGQKDFINLLNNMLVFDYYNEQSDKINENI